MAPGFLPLAMSKFSSDVQEVNLPRNKKSLFCEKYLVPYCYVLLGICLVVTLA